jgi:fructosamine-3-kinase
MNFSEWQQIANNAGVGTVETTQTLQESDHQQCWQVVTDRGIYFVKTQLKRYAPLLTTQARNLRAIAQTRTLRCPLVIAEGQTHKTAWLILEWLALKQTGDQAQLGQQLGALHRHTATQFGWQETNFIGQSIQYNHPLADWAAFFRAQRLLPQLRWASERGLAHSTVKKIEHLLEEIDGLFIDYQPQASLLHGNFSAENIAFLEDGTPVIFNPSSYYGDREMDLASLTLSDIALPAFYRAYQEECPLDKGHEQRKTLYQLYYLLNNVNTFGGEHYTILQHYLDNHF